MSMPAREITDTIDDVNEVVKNIVKERNELREALRSIIDQIDDAVDQKIHNGRLPPIGALLSTIQDTARTALNNQKEQSE